MGVGDEGRKEEKTLRTKLFAVHRQDVTVSISVLEHNFRRAKTAWSLPLIKELRSIRRCQKPHFRS